MRKLVGIIGLVGCFLSYFFGSFILFFGFLGFFGVAALFFLFMCMILSLMCMFAEDEMPGIWLLILSIFIVLFTGRIFLLYMLLCIGAGFFCMIYNRQDEKSNEDSAKIL